MRSPGLGGARMQTMSHTTANLIDIDEIRRTYQLLVSPGQIVEIRALEASTQPNSRYLATYSGYFDNLNDLLAQLRTIRRATGIYITLQPCHPDLLHRAKNKLVERNKRDTATSDSQIIRYAWLPIDSDPERIAGISSTNEEHVQAIAHSQVIREALQAEGWPAPILADSGNGSHLLYKIDLATTESDLVKRVLEGLAARFNAPGVHVDQTLFNPSRIIKLYGTRVCKGDDTQERPHRMSRLLEVPEDIQFVTRAQLEAIATPAQASTVRASNGHRPSELHREDFTAEKFIQQHQIEVSSMDDYQGGTRYHLAVCPWNPSHTDASACIYQFADGRLGASCSHNSCRGKGWRDLRLVFEPDAYTPKAQPAEKSSDEPQKNESDQAPEEKTKEPSAQTRLTWIAERAEFIHTTSGALFARVPVNGHHELVSINEHGSGFRRWLVYTFKHEYGFVPNSDALSQVMAGVQATAEYEGRRAKVYTRIAEKDGCVYLDLANEKWQCVKISSCGWEVIDHPPVYFRRPNGMLPLPIPQRGGSLKDLRRLIHAKDDNDYVLILSWLLGTLHPTGPYPVLNLNGVRGSTKTRTERVLRNLVDPNEAPTRNAPKDEREAAIAAHNNMVVALDNLSSIPLWLSDVLCRIATGSGFGTRTLYTDDDETVFSSKRPIILNGIEDGIISQGDLLSRTMLVTLEPPDRYRSEEDMDELFRELHPKLLGALLTAASIALRDRKKVQMESTPRMVDFARWVIAAEPALGWKAGTFLTTYTENQDNASSIVTESSPVAKAIIQFLANEPKQQWTGLISKLHTELEKYEVYTKAKTAPKTANKLSGQLKRIAPALQAQGIVIHPLPRTKEGSGVALSNIAGVDKSGSGVDKSGSGVDKNPVSTPDFSLAERRIDSESSQNGVGSVDKHSQLSALLSSDLVEKKEEKEQIPDNLGILSTSPTLPTPASPQKDTHHQIKALSAYPDTVEGAVKFIQAYTALGCALHYYNGDDRQHVEVPGEWTDEEFAAFCVQIDRRDTLLRRLIPEETPVQQSLEI